jgi:predicted 3-demethylubiquinone-9 3-methyltransferase (glyoxalase superfamily)
MNNPIYPCLWFDGKAKEAANFYSSVFEDSKTTENSASLLEMKKLDIATLENA